MNATIGLFANANGINLGATPPEMVFTSGHTQLGAGSAKYVRDNLVSSSFVTANPRWSFRTAAGEGYRLSEDQRIDLTMFGAIADDFGHPPSVNGSASDCYPAWQAANAFLSAFSRSPIASYNLLHNLFVPLGFYYSSQTWELKTGAFNLEFNLGARVRFPANTAGIIIHSYNTTGTTVEATPTSRANGSVLRNVYVLGGGGTDTGKNGIWLRASAVLENCNANEFPGDGVRILASAGAGGAIEGNANTFSIHRLGVVRNGGHGLYVKGADVNAGYAYGVNAAYNARFGIFDDSFLGNGHFAHHTEANGTTQAGPTGQGATPTIVHHNGQHYSVKIGQEAWCSTNPPSGTTVSNQGWLWVVTAGAAPWAGIPNWASGTTYASGGAYASPGLNSRNTFINCYAEGAQGVCQIGPTTTWDGGVTGVPVHGGAYRGVRNYAPLTRQTVTENQSVDGQTLQTIWVNQEPDNHVFSSKIHSSYAPLGYQEKFITPNYFFPFAYNGESSKSPFAITTAASTETFGRASGQPYVLTVARIAINGRLHSAIDSLADLPNGSEVARGEIYYRINPSPGGKLGWVCTTGGIVGSGAVFKEFGAIDP